MPNYNLATLENDREYRCCFIFHVRTATLLTGIFTFLVQTIVLSILVTYLINPSARPDFGSGDGINGVDQRLLITDPGIYLLNLASEKRNKFVSQLSNEMKANSIGNVDIVDGQPHASPPPTAHEKETAQPTLKNNALANASAQGEDLWRICMILMYLFFTYLLILGALYRRPSYILPYFSLLIFDFVLACLKVMGYMTYMPQMKLNHNSNGDMADLKSKYSATNDNDQYMLRLRRFGDHSGPGLALVSLAFLFLALKTYIMGITWTCYKYLVLHQRLMESTGLLRNLDEPSVNSPNGLRYALRDVWSQMRMTWISSGRGYATRGGLMGVRLTRGDQEGFQGESDALLSSLADNEPDHREAEAPAEVVEPPKYEELLKQPANAHMPPPYFKSSEQRGGSK